MSKRKRRIFTVYETEADKSVPRCIYIHKPRNISRNYLHGNLAAAGYKAFVPESSDGYEAKFIERFGFYVGK